MVREQECVKCRQSGQCSSSVSHLDKKSDRKCMLRLLLLARVQLPRKEKLQVTDSNDINRKRIAFPFQCCCQEREAENVIKSVLVNSRFCYFCFCCLWAVCPQRPTCSSVHPLRGVLTCLLQLGSTEVLCMLLIFLLSSIAMSSPYTVKQNLENCVKLLIDQ